MTIDVNAVPPILREYTFPSKPTVNAPIALTTSERLNMKWFAILFAAYDTHEIATMTTSSGERSGCRFASEESTENVGTIANCVHHGNGRRNQPMSGGR